ncbi:MAG: hypothetical protein Q9190_002733 [Brigantiaea leucoxantha]
MSPPSALDVEAVSDTQAVSFVERLNVDGVAARRNKAPPVATGVAAYATSEMFKSPGHGKPKAKNWNHLLTEESKSRKPSALKSAAQHLRKPGLISLGGGLPSSEAFPFEYLEAKVPSPPYFSEQATAETGVLTRGGKHDAAEGKSIYGASE